MRVIFKKTLLIVIVIILFALALLGAILPIIPGFIFFFAGVIVLSWLVHPYEDGFTNYYIAFQN